MAKVNAPLFSNFYEAFGSIFVFQRNHRSNVIARQKTGPVYKPRSAHYRTNIPKWSFAVHEYLHNNPGNKSLKNMVAWHAIPPNPPSSLYVFRKTKLANPPNTWRVIIAWTAPTNKYNGMPLENFAGYWIYLRTGLGSFIKKNTTLYTQTAWTIQLQPNSYEYKMEAVDSVGNISVFSATLNFSVP